MGKILVIKGADFSQVAVDKVNPSPVPPSLSEFIKNTIQLRGRTETSFEVLGKPWRAASDVFTPDEVGLSVGDTITFNLPANYIFGNRKGSTADNLATNNYWYWTTNEPVTEADKNNGAVKAVASVARLGQRPFTLAEYNCIIFAPNGSETLPALDITTIKGLIDSGDIVFMKQS